MTKTRNIKNISQCLTDEVIMNMVVEWTHELASTKRGTTGEGVAREHLVKLSEEIDRRKDLGSWSLSNS